MDNPMDSTAMLRELDPGEAGLVEKLWKDLYREQVEMHPGLQLANSGFNEWASAFEGIIGRFGFITVAIEHGIPVGFIAGRIKMPTPPFLADPVGFISEVFVDAENRGKRLGKKLMGYAEEWFSSQEIVSMELQVLTGNHHAKNFYKLNGWKASVLHMVRNIQTKTSF